MAIKNPGEIKPARIIATVWVFITLSCGVIVGIIGKALYPNLADGETIFMTMVQNMFSPIIAGVLLTAILAAVMSTADSQLLVASSAIAGDLYNGSINKNADGKTLVWVSRFAVLTVSILAASLVFIPNPEPGTILAKINASVFKLVSFAWAGFGAAFSPIILFSLFWRKTTKEGAIFGILAGGLSALLWWLKDGGIWDIYEILPGFIISSVVIVIVSLFTKNSQEILDEFDKVNKD
jgi:sodium/proline symporter